MADEPYFLAQYDHLGDDGFANFLNSILKEIFGPSLTPFGKGKDGGRDAIYEGIPKKYEKIEGYWIFQYKFHELSRVGNSYARSKVKSDLPEEIEKVLKRPKKPDCYIFITNAELFSSDFGDWFDTEIKSKYKSYFRHLDVWDSKRIAMWIRDPDLSKLREKFIPDSTINLNGVGDLIRKELASEHYPFEALSKIKSAISSRNFDWFNDTLKKYYNLVSIETRRELAEITLNWLKKYPDCSKYVFATLNDILKPINLSLNSEHIRAIEDYSLEIIPDILSQLLENFQRDEDESSLKKLNEFIITRFDLISDNSGHSFSSPKNIYSTLKKLNPNSSDALKIVTQLSYQFTGRFGEIYTGHELMGGSISQSGSEFSISDLAIVDDLLSPLLKDNYTRNPSDTWTKIEDEILSRKISKSNPTWVLRSTIPVLLERLSDNFTEQEAKNWLKKLIQLKEGIPSFSDKIFHNLRHNVDHYSPDTLLELIETEIAIYGIPTNVFIVILLFELIKRENQRAREILFSLLENEKYLNYDWFNFHTLVHFNIIAKQPEIKIGIISKLLNSKLWRDKAEKEHGGFAIMADLPRAFQSMAVESAILKNGNLNFLDEFLEDKTDDLKIKVVFECLPELAKRYPIETFSFIKEQLEDKEKIEEFIKDTYTRSQVVSVGDELANEGMGKEALWIVEKFINDPDPQIDDDEEFNYHKQIQRGEEVIVISTVRGRLPWVLQRLALYEEFIVDSFIKTRDLIKKENNLYVIQQCIIPLMEIVVRRVWLKTEDRLIELRDILFDILRKYSKYQSIGKRLTSVFIHYRDLDNNQANEVINYLVDVPDIAPFIIYYAIYRKNMFREKGKFDSERFDKILKDKIRNGSDELRRQIAWHFWKILGDRKDDFVRIKEYMDEFASSPYSRGSFYSILDIVEENLKDHYTVCIEWFNNILDRTIQYTKDPKNPKDLAFGTQLSDIVKEIAKESADDYLETVKKIRELALINEVIMYDIKRIFESYKLVNPKNGKTILPTLESIWVDLTKKYPMLVEIDWKG